MSTIARNFSAGVELSEDGLNAISALFHNQRPDLFESAKDIVVDPTTSRLLKLYAFVYEPLTFNLHPVGSSDVERDELFVVGKLEFALTDEIPGGGGLGLITRIKVTIEASMALRVDTSVTQQAINAELTGLRFVDFQSTHPRSGGNFRSVQSVDVGASLSDQPHGAVPLTTDPAFIAILNYLIEVFLEDGLRRPVEQFPFPPLHLLPQSNISLYLRGLQIDGNTLGVYLHRQPGDPIVPGSLPPSGNVQLGIGLVEPLISDILRASLPYTANIGPTPDNRTFSIRGGSWIRVNKRSYIDLRAPDSIKARLNFEGLIKGQVNVKLGRYWVRAGVPFPIDELSLIEGIFKPFIEETDDQFLVRMRPSEDFFEPTAIVIVTDFREYISNAVRDWLRRNVTPIFRKIPIIGWIIAKGVEVIVGELLGYFVGALLDTVASFFLTLLATALFNVARLLFNDEIAFTVYELDKKLPITDVDMALKSLSLPDIGPNAGGELMLHAAFDGAGMPLPVPPVPTPPDDPIDIPTPGGPMLPQDPDAAFQPSFNLQAPQWIDGGEFDYDIVATVMGEVMQLAEHVEFGVLTGPDRLVVKTQTMNSNGVVIARREATLDKTGALISELEQEVVDDGSGPQSIETQSVYDHVGNTVEVVSNVSGSATESASFRMPAGARMVPSAQTMFALMTAFNVGDEGMIGRLDINLGTEYENWARTLAAKLRVLDSEEILYDGQNILCNKVEIQDAELIGTFWIEVAAPHRIMEAEQRVEDIMTLTMKLR